MIPYGKQHIDSNDIDSVVKVLQSDFLTDGPEVPKFERAIQKLCGCDYAIAVNSATSALHIACLALDIGVDDTVWTSPISFVASANCALYCGAAIDFVDIDPKTYNLSAEALKIKLEHAKDNHQPLPMAIIVVHLSGQSCEMEKIHQLAQDYNFKIIEDASHAIGGFYNDQPIGNGRYSDITIFSFHPVKIITTAEGGVACTQNAELAQSMKLLRSHGITRDPKLMSSDKHGDWYYQQIKLGFNYRMNDLQAALGLSQLKKIQRFIQRRNAIAHQYDSRLAHLALQLPMQCSKSKSSRHLYIIRLKLDKISMSHKDVFDSLRASGIGVNLHYIPIHTQPFYQNLGFKNGDFPESELYYTEAMSIPLHPQMSDEDVNHVINTFENILK